MIFIPIFVGNEILGHWLNLIVEKTEDDNILVFMADSLGKENEYHNIKTAFHNTPLGSENNNVKWIFLEGIQQEAGSMDCGVFTMLVFARYLLMKTQTKVNLPLTEIRRIKYDNISAKQFGKQGRKDIAKAIEGKKIDFY